MKRGKKIALIALMVVVALAGTIGGVAMAQSDEEEATTTSETARFAYLERVSEIYQEKTGVALDVDALQDSLCQAGGEKKEQIRNQFRQRLINEGVFTEEELSEMEDWWEAKPDNADKFNGIKNRFSHRLAAGIHGWCQNGNSGE